MNRIEVVSKIGVYEVNGVEPGHNTPRPQLTVAAHRIYNDRVILCVDSQSFTVIASDLRKAIENATNAG